MRVGGPDRSDPTAQFAWNTAWRFSDRPPPVADRLIVPVLVAFLLLKDPPNHSVNFPDVTGTVLSGGPVMPVTLPWLSNDKLDGGYAVKVTLPLNVKVNHASCALFTLMCSTPLPVPTMCTKSFDSVAGQPGDGGNGEPNSSSLVK